MTAPTLTDLDAPTFLENTVNTTPQIIDADVTLIDPEGDFDGGKVVVGGLLAEDIVAVRDQGSGAGQIGYNSGTGEVSYGGVVIGTAVGGAGATLTITLNASATTAAVEALIENLTYANSSDAPTASRTLTIQVTDAAGLAYEQTSGAANPLDGEDVGGWSKPGLVDLDDDGDLDLVVGDLFGGLAYFENTGTTAAPVFVQQVGASNPFDGFGVGNYSAPTFADLDGDSDLDMVVGDAVGNLSYFENTGTAAAPVFVEQVGGANPFDGFDVGFRAAPTLGDLDGDGDLDMVAGALSGLVSYFENTGTSIAPVFVERAGAANPFDGIDIGEWSTPVLIDQDGDGDLDLVLGGNNAAMRYYENTGTAFAPVFVQRTGADNPFNGLDVGVVESPTFGDLDGDGDLDLIIGNYDGRLDTFMNTTTGVVSVTVTAQDDGTAAVDLLKGGAGDDIFDGGDDDDVLKGFDGDDTLEGGDGDDTLVGGAGDDTLNGGAGNDDLNGGPGADTMAGGTGDDYYTVDADDTVIENDGEGTDTVRSYTTYTLGAFVENLVLGQTANVNGTGNALNNVITGNVGNNTLSGGDGDDTIYGQGGNDVISGGNGDDTLEGGTGDDFLLGNDGSDILVGGAGNDQLGGESMSGGTGDDTYFVEAASNTVTELANQGHWDTVYSYINTYQLPDNVEVLRGTMGVKQTLIGNDLNNIVQGWFGDDIIDGRGGNDTLWGYEGNDRVTGGAGADTFLVLSADIVPSTLGGTRQVDVIMDFTPGDGDRVDLRSVDADINTGSDQAFTFVSSFSRTAGEARIAYNAGTNTTTLQLDVDGDGKADYQLNLKGGDFTGTQILVGDEPSHIGGWLL